MAPSSCFLWIDVFVLDQVTEHSGTTCEVLNLGDGLSCCHLLLLL